MTNPVVLCQDRLADYRVPLFAQLARALPGGLVVAHGPGGAGDGPWDAGFERLPLRRHALPVGSAYWLSFAAALRRWPRPRALILGQNPRNLATLPLLLLARARGVPTLLWGHGRTQRRDVTVSRHPKDRVHRAQMRLAGAVVTYTEGGRRAAAAVVGEARAHLAPNTLDTGPLFAVRRGLEPEGQGAVRARLGLPAGPLVAFIGRLERDKSPAAVLDLLARLRADGLAAHAIFIGDGELRAALADAAQAAGSSARFLGRMTPEAAAPWLFAADFLFLPDWVGLAAVHAFALGLPLLTRTPAPGAPDHPPEIEYVRHGDTGLIVPHAAGDALAAAAHRLIAERAAFSARASAFAEEHLAVERWVAGMVRAIDYVADPGANPRSG